MIKKAFLKACAAVFVLFLALGAFAVQGGDGGFLAIDVSAAFNSYKMTESYRSGKYYDNLCAVTLTGDAKKDVLAIALSQLGYHEGDSNSDFHGESKTGTRDFVEYNVLYGRLDNNQGNGMSYGYYWCASFVNWCMRQAGVSEKASGGAEVSCQRWLDDCKSYGIYRSKSGYVPNSADIIFFKDEGSALDSTHVGIVRYSDGIYVYTVEGNTSNGSDYSSNGEYVALKRHTLTSNYIVGYASPEYNNEKTSRRVDRSGGFLSPGEYISTKDIFIYKNDAMSEKSEELIPAFSVFDVKDVSDGRMSVEYNGVKGYVERNDDFVQLTSHKNVYTVSYVDENGERMYMPQFIIEGQKRNSYSNVPVREDKGFVAWKVDGSEKTVAPGSPLPIEKGDITLCAVWDSEIYTVSFVNHDGSVIAQYEGYYGTEYEIPTPTVIPDQKVFYGWDAATDGKITGNNTYTAMFVSEEELVAADSKQNAAINDVLNGCSLSTGGYAGFIAAVFMGFIMIAKKKKDSSL